MRSTKLEKTNLLEAHLQNADMSKANLSHAIMRRAQMRQTHFPDATVAGAGSWMVLDWNSFSSTSRVVAQYLAMMRVRLSVNLGENDHHDVDHI